MNQTVNVRNQIENKAQSGQTGINWGRVIQGFLAALAVLAMLAFWGTFAYALVTGDVKLATTFGYIIGIMVAIVVPVQLLYTFYKKFAK